MSVCRSSISSAIVVGVDVAGSVEVGIVLKVGEGVKVNVGVGEGLGVGVRARTSEHEVTRNAVTKYNNRWMIGFMDILLPGGGQSPEG
jgi:hypothetical protein